MCNPLIGENLPQWKGRSVSPLSFIGTLNRLKWWTLASPNDKYDPALVPVFYANAYPTEEGGEIFEHKSWVRGKVIWYDRDTINAMLNHPYEKRDGHLDGYHRMLAKTRTLSNRFKNSVIAEILCIPGRSYSTNNGCQPKRIYRKHMTT
ncbi:hypothetical protein Lal_00031405 [Lupinus albus]|nr:hypothetical protein Lal_00031405 [Lupinus albus]